MKISVTRSFAAAALTTVVAALAVAAPAQAACDGADVRPDTSNLDAIGQTTVCLINEQRAANGLSTLSQNHLLAAAASEHNRNMVALSFFDHTGKDGSTIRDRIGKTGYLVPNAAWTIGENLAWGSGSLGTPRAIVIAWMKSPGHRANILNGTYREIGIAVDYGVPDASLQDAVGATYTTEFGTVDAPVVDSTPAATTSTTKRPVAKRSLSKSRCKKAKAKRARASKRSRACKRARSSRRR